MALNAAEHGIKDGTISVYHFPFGGNNAYVITRKNLQEEVSIRVAELIPLGDTSKKDIIGLSKMLSSKFGSKRISDVDWNKESSGEATEYIGLFDTISLSDILNAIQEQYGNKYEIHNV